MVFSGHALASTPRHGKAQIVATTPTYLPRAVQKTTSSCALGYFTTHPVDCRRENSSSEVVQMYAQGVHLFVDVVVGRGG